MNDEPEATHWSDPKFASEGVYLSELKFAGTPPITLSSSNTKPTATHPNPVHARTSSDPGSSDLHRLKPHERVSLELEGEELMPHASIWQVYLQEAKKFDEELVEGQNKNPDMILLFAALFSAIVTGFLIESKDLLKQDSGDVTVTLLLLIAQSQQRIEQNAPRFNSPPIELPQFVAPLSARWINGLWFSSLALSLSAALVAMVAKGWLTAFTNSLPRSAYTYSILRQARLAGLDKWHAIPIIDLVFSMLHLSILLFSLGLILYLRILDSSIAMIIAFIAGTTLLFYISTALLGAIYESCPFVTQLSKRIQRTLNSFFGSWIIRKGDLHVDSIHRSSQTTNEELSALIWLADSHHRDPDAVEHVYLSLSGLRLPTSEPNTSSTALINRGVIPGEGTTITKKFEPSNEPSIEFKLVHQLYEKLCTRLSQALVRRPRSLAVSQGFNIARYACALPQMVQFLETCSDQEQISNVTSANDSLPPAKNLAQAALKALDTIWRNECPPLSSSSYTLLTSAELRLTTIAAAPHCVSILKHTQPQSHDPESMSPAGTASHKGSSATDSFVEITMDPMKNALSGATMSLFDLRARYSRALSRAGFLLRYHGENNVPIDDNALIHVLDSVRVAGQTSPLNPESYLSTHQPQSESLASPIFFVRVDGVDVHWVRPQGVGDVDGLLVGLLRLLADDKVQTTPPLERAAAGALSSIAPILLKQWQKMPRSHGERVESKYKEITKNAFEHWPTIQDVDSMDQVKAALTQQMITIATFAVSHAGCPGMNDLPEQAIAALYKRFQIAPSYFKAPNQLFSDSDGVDCLIIAVDGNSQILGLGVQAPFINTFLLKHKGRTLFQFPGIASNSIPAFLRILSTIPNQVSELQALLAALEDKVRDNPWYLWPFTGSDEGFSALLKIGERDEYRSLVAKCVTRIVKTAAARSSNTPIEARAVPGAFDAIAFALEALASDDEDRRSLLTSTHTLLTALHIFPQDALCSIATSASAINLSRTLRNMDELFEIRADLLTELEELDGWLYAYGLPAEGLATFFEQSVETENDSQDVAFSFD